MPDNLRTGLFFENAGMAIDSRTSYILAPRRALIFLAQKFPLQVADLLLESLG
jgi:hypothetical protein